MPSSVQCEWHNRGGIWVRNSKDGYGLIQYWLKKLQRQLEIYMLNLFGERC